MTENMKFKNTPDFCLFYINTWYYGTHVHLWLQYMALCVPSTKSLSSFYILNMLCEGLSFFHFIILIFWNFCEVGSIVFYFISEISEISFII